MDYVKVEGGQVVKFPYSMQEFRADHKQTSFPSPIPEEVLAQYGCFPVYPGSLPTDSILSHMVLRADMPTYNGTRWEIAYTTQPLPQPQASQNVRAEREMRLTTTDWVVTKSVETGVSVPQEWLVYRQSLRDITSQAGFPWTIIWPTKPE